MANGLPISKETFRKLPTPEDKLDSLFDVLAHMNESGYENAGDREKRRGTCETRFTKLERRKWGDRSISGMAGAVTGFLAGLLKGG